MPVGLDATTARVVGKAHQSTVLIGVEILSVIQFANAFLEALDIACKQLLALGFGDGCVDATAVTVFFAVMTVPCSILAYCDSYK